jgi:hypothetical protein
MLMSVFILPMGARVRTFPKPTSSFHALAVDPQALRKHGLPARPHDSELANHWESTVHMIKTVDNYVVPTFSASEDVHHGPRLAGPVPGTSMNCAGAILAAPPGKSLRWVHAEWNLPTDLSPADDIGTPASMGCWIGLSGDEGADALQLGADCRVEAGDSGIQRRFQFWWEWYPESQVRIENLAAVAGDVVNCTICTDPEAAKKAFICIANLTQGKCTAFEVTAPADSLLRGKYGEWMVGRPKVGGSLQPLPRFDYVHFGDAYAGVTHGPEQYVDAGAAAKISMNDTGQSLVDVTSERNQEIRCTGTRR